MKTREFKEYKNICLAAGLLLAAACTPEENIPGVKHMDVTISQSYVDDGLKAQWEVGDSVSVFFNGIRSPKYFTVTSVSEDKESATINGDYPYGLDNGTVITAIYPHTSISADVASIPVDLSKLSYKDGAIDMSSMVYSAKAIYSKDKITTLGFNALTSKVSIEIEPFEGLDVSKLERVDVISNDFTSTANVNLMADEGSDPWMLRVNNGLSVTLNGAAAKSRAENGNIKIDMICIPTETGKSIGDFSVFISSGDEVYYADVKGGFTVDKNSPVASSEVSELLDNEESIEKSSGALWQKLQSNNMTYGAIRDKDSKFIGYYRFDYESKKVSLWELSSDAYSRGDAAVNHGEQSFETGFFSFDFSEPVCGVNGISYDLSSGEITLIKEEGAQASFIEGNHTAVADFLKGTGAHYEVKIDRSSTDTPKFTRGAISKTLWQGAMAQGYMNTIELNKDRGWAFVTLPNNYTSYQMKYSGDKDILTSQWTGGYDYDTDKDINLEKLGDNILKNFVSQEGVTSLCVPYVSGKHTYLIINEESGEWFNFQPQNENL